MDAVYTDFSKAFDRVNHVVLLEKLRAVGFCDDLVGWFHSYLTERRQVVKINNFTSREISETSGVPQGAHCSPLLFNLFINDIVSSVSNSSCLLFADDMKIYRTVSNVNDCQLLQRDLDRMGDWCKVNGLSLNASKCSVISFSKKRSPRFLFDYDLNHVHLTRVDLVRDYRGIGFDCSLSFNEHINIIANKALKTLGFVLRNCKDLSVWALQIVYCSLGKINFRICICYMESSIRCI